MTVKELEDKKPKTKKASNNDEVGAEYRKPEFYNVWRLFFQYLVTHIGYMITFKLLYRLEVHGKENIPKDNRYIVASNHLSTLDPPLVCGIMNKGVAYMAKKELFRHPLLNWWLNWLGAFAVDREKLGFSTVKTVMSINKTNWVLGIFPQGTRQEPGEISGVTKGFATIAKKTKCDILPVGIVGTNKKSKMLFAGKIIVNIGKPISYEEEIPEIVDKWGKSIEELTGFKYIPGDSLE